MALASADGQMLGSLAREARFEDRFDEVITLLSYITRPLTAGKQESLARRVGVEES